MRKTKDSGIEWIGKMPSDWEVRSLKRVALIKTGSTPTKSENSYNYSDNDLMWVKPDNLTYSKPINQTKEYLSPLGLDNVTITDPYSILVCCIGSIGKLGYSDKPVSYNQQINAVTFNSSNIYWKYGLYVLISAENQHWYYSNGNVLKILNNQGQGKIKIPVPRLSIQRHIADYLDKKIFLIDNIIDKTKQTIEEYKKYKQSLITEAVTKELNHYVKMKNSGVEWIGQIPEHWNVIKMKFISILKGRIGWQGLTSDEYCDEGPYLITGKDFLNGGIDWKSCVHISIERWKEAKDIQIKNGDLLITKDGTVGKIAIVDNLAGMASLNSGVLKISLNELYDVKFMYWVLQSNIFWKWFSLKNAGNSTIIHLYQHDFANFSFAKPLMKEQKEISDYLDKKISEIEETMTKKQQLLTNLESYKKSLIYETVTGKREVT